VSDGTNSLTFNERTPAGLPLSAEYSNGVQVNWQYQFKQYVSQMKYSKAGQLISEFDAGYDSIGRRHAFAVTTQDGQAPSEVAYYSYDGASRLSTETRS